MTTTVPCTLMRAGTSRGPFFLREWLPNDEALLEQALIGAIGASDPLQLDGLGGGSSLNSKVAIVSRSLQPDCDLDYLFAQVGVGIRSVDMRPNCGNMLSGVVPFAIEQGLIEPTGDQTTVRVFNENTKAKIDVTVCTPGGRLTYDGTTRIDGVAGTAAPVLLSFLDCWGTVTGKLFPTGRRIDIIEGIEVTCIDAAMPLMILKASALGLIGNEKPAELDDNMTFLTTLERLRLIAGERMGLGDVSDSVVPKPVIVSPGDDIESITSRYFTPRRCHTSHAVTGAIGVATAFALPGTVASGTDRIEGRHTLAVLHPEGRIEVEVTLQRIGNAIRVERAALVRTARKIMQGELTLPSYVFATPTSDDIASDSKPRAREVPVQRIDIVVPTNPGGANDAVARLVAQALSSNGRRTVNIDFRAGAGGTIACCHASRMPPDGSTLLLGYTATHAIHPAWEALGYDPVADFAPVGLVCSSPTVLLVPAHSSVDSVACLLDRLHRPACALRYAASGRGTLPHLAAELLARTTGATVHGRYFEGSAPALDELCQGGADFMIGSLYAALPYLRAGKLQALAVSSTADHPVLTGVPSMETVGLDTLDLAQWYGLFAPRRTPTTIIASINDQIAAMLARTDVIDRLQHDGAAAGGGSAESLARMLNTEARRWREIVAHLHRDEFIQTMD